MDELATIPATINKDQGLTLLPKTTEQEDLTLASQRRVNLIWEHTQAVIALFVVFTCIGSAIWSSTRGQEPSAFLAFICGNVIGFYFSRTNHAAIGGIGPKKQPEGVYSGR